MEVRLTDAAVIYIDRGPGFSGWRSRVPEFFGHYYEIEEWALMAAPRAALAWARQQAGLPMLKEKL